MVPCLLVFYPWFIAPPSPLFSSVPAVSTVSVHFHLLSLPYMPLPPTHNTPLSPLLLPLNSHKNSFKSGGKFIRSKNKQVPVFVLLLCCVPKGCTMLLMGHVCSPRLGSVHTQNTHAFQRTLRSSYHFYFQPCYCLYTHHPLKPIWPQSFPVGSQQ